MPRLKFVCLGLLASLRFKNRCQPQTPTLERRNPGESLRLTYAPTPYISAHSVVTKPQSHQQYQRPPHFYSLAH